MSTLSGGQKRRLDIALGLIHEPPLLFLDEPSTGMDPQNRANLWEHIMRLREERGTTIVLTTHYLEEADTMAERVIVIDHGLIIADDTPERLKAEQAGDRVRLTVHPRDVPTARQVLDRTHDRAEPVQRPGRRAPGRPSRPEQPRPARARARAARTRRRGDRRLGRTSRRSTTSSSTSPAAACAKPQRQERQQHDRDRHHHRRSRPPGLAR